MSRSAILNIMLNFQFARISLIAVMTPYNPYASLSYPLVTEYAVPTIGLVMFVSEFATAGPLARYINTLYSYLDVGRIEL